jgi:uncharacterized ferredoxin-like protein
MTTADVERLYRMLESIDKRIQEIEEELAENRGKEDARNMTKTQVVAIIGVISALTGTATAIITSVI